MLYRSLFPRDLFADLERLQREFQGGLEPSPSIRGLGRGGYPALNVGRTPTSVEVYAFAPGMDPAAIDVNLERGVLTIAGELGRSQPAPDEKATLHVNERSTGASAASSACPTTSTPTPWPPATATACCT